MIFQQPWPDTQLQRPNNCPFPSAAVKCHGKRALVEPLWHHQLVSTLWLFNSLLWKMDENGAFIDDLRCLPIKNCDFPQLLIDKQIQHHAAWFVSDILAWIWTPSSEMFTLAKNVDHVKLESLLFTRDPMFQAAQSRGGCSNLENSCFCCIWNLCNESYWYQAIWRNMEVNWIHHPILGLKIWNTNKRTNQS